MSIEFRIRVTCDGWYCLIVPGGKGSARIDWVKSEYDLQAGVSPSHTLTVSLTNPETSWGEVETQFDSWLIDLLSPLLDSYINNLSNWLTEELERLALIDIAPLTQYWLSAVATSESFEVDRLDLGGGSVRMNQYFDFSSVDFTADSGAELMVRAIAFPSATEITTENLGVPDRAGCGSASQNPDLPNVFEIEAVVVDDYLNQQLYAAWLAGWLETSLPPSSIDVTGYPVTDVVVSVSARLPLTVSDCSGEWLMSLGDLRVFLSLVYDETPIDVIANATVTFEIVTATTDSDLTFSVGDPMTADFDFGVIQEAGEGYRSELRSIIEDFLLDGFATAVSGQPLGRISLFKADISQFVLSIPGTHVSEMEPSNVSHTSGDTLVTGTLKD